MNETAGPFVRSQPLAKSEIRLQVPVCVLVDLTAIPTIQRECWEDDAADVISDLRCFFQNGLIVRIALFGFVVIVLELPFRVMGNRNTGVLCVDALM